MTQEELSEIWGDFTEGQAEREWEESKAEGARFARKWCYYYLEKHTVLFSIPCERGQLARKSICLVFHVGFGIARYGDREIFDAWWTRLPLVLKWYMSWMFEKFEKFGAPSLREAEETPTEDAWE